MPGRRAPRRAARAAIAGATFAVAIALVLPGVARGRGEAATSAAYVDGPPPAHTGGFGEPTCRQCHFDLAADDSAGTVAVTGMPREYAPGRSYRLTISIARAAIGAGGFQIAARYASGPGASGPGVGAQAGSFRAIDGRVQVVTDGMPEIQYAQHTADGVAPAAPDSARWVVEWIAPVRAGSVILHVAGNAANGDDSQFGDYIYATSMKSNARMGREKE